MLGRLRANKRLVMSLGIKSMLLSCFVYDGGFVFVCFLHEKHFVHRHAIVTKHCIFNSEKQWIELNDPI